MSDMAENIVSSTGCSKIDVITSVYQLCHEIDIIRQHLWESDDKLMTVKKKLKGDCSQADLEFISQELPTLLRSVKEMEIKASFLEDRSTVLEDNLCSGKHCDH